MKESKILSILNEMRTRTDVVRSRIHDVRIRTHDGRSRTHDMRLRTHDVRLRTHVMSSQADFEILIEIIPETWHKSHK